MVTLIPPASRQSSDFDPNLFESSISNDSRGFKRWLRNDSKNEILDDVFLSSGNSDPLDVSRDISVLQAFKTTGLLSSSSSSCSNLFKREDAEVEHPCVAGTSTSTSDRPKVPDSAINESFDSGLNQHLKIPGVMSSCSSTGIFKSDDTIVDLLCLSSASTRSTDRPKGHDAGINCSSAPTINSQLPVLSFSRRKSALSLQENGATNHGQVASHQSMDLSRLVFLSEQVSLSTVDKDEQEGDADDQWLHYIESVLSDRASFPDDDTIEEIVRSTSPVLNTNVTSEAIAQEQPAPLTTSRKSFGLKLSSGRASTNTVDNSEREGDKNDQWSYYSDHLCSDNMPSTDGSSTEVVRATSPVVPVEPPVMLETNISTEEATLQQPSAPPSFSSIPPQGLRCHRKTSRKGARTRCGSYTAEQKKYVEQVGDADVICARGGRSNSHIGNQAYLAEKDRLQPEYLAASNNQRKAISQELVDFILKRGGRFLKQEAGTDLWYELKEADCRDKARQALRDINTPEARARKRSRYRCQDCCRST